jgi:hypothetical protein
MLSIFRGARPDITPAQFAAVLVAGVPVVATLLSAFGVADLGARQQEALADALTWAGVLAGALIGGDAALRAARNAAESRRDAAAMHAGAVMAPLAAGDLDDLEVDEHDLRLAVSDDEEPADEAEIADLEARMVAEDPDAVEPVR